MTWMFGLNNHVVTFGTYDYKCNHMCTLIAHETIVNLLVIVTINIKIHFLVDSFAISTRIKVILLNKQVEKTFDYIKMSSRRRSSPQTLSNYSHSISLTTTSFTSTMNWLSIKSIRITPNYNKTKSIAWDHHLQNTRNTR